MFNCLHYVQYELQESEWQLRITIEKVDGMDGNSSQIYWIFAWIFHKKWIKWICLTVQHEISFKSTIHTRASGS